MQFSHQFLAGDAGACELARAMGGLAKLCRLGAIFFGVKTTGDFLPLK